MSCELRDRDGYCFLLISSGGGAAGGTLCSAGRLIDQLRSSSEEVTCESQQSWNAARRGPTPGRRSGPGVRDAAKVTEARRKAAIAKLRGGRGR